VNCYGVRQPTLLAAIENVMAQARLNDFVGLYAKRGDHKANPILRLPMKKLDRMVEEHVRPAMVDR